MGFRTLELPQDSAMSNPDQFSEGEEPSFEGAHHDVYPERVSPRYLSDSEGYQASMSNTELPPRDGPVPGIPDGAEAVLPSRADELLDRDRVDAWGFPIAEPRNTELDPEAGWMPDSELSAVALGSEHLEGSRQDRQVNVRLDESHYSALCAAAELYGTRPTTFARMLINRGAQATLAAHRAEFLMNPKD